MRTRNLGLGVARGCLAEEDGLVMESLVTVLRSFVISLQTDVKSRSFVRCTEIWVKVEIVRLDAPN